jgi:UDP-N-acetylglucosamine--N-acetylmuramyl-(pentapeptide) pyrophosphoryl-undecaprenol N-acetylglucosamine transferase
MKKILICGGHPTPALSLVDELLLEQKLSIVFVGRKYAIDSERTLSYEYKECQKRNIRFVELQAGKLTRIASRSSLVGLLRFPLGFFIAAAILIKERPSLIMSFGGYIALPIALWGKIFGIPVFTHEQTMKAGAANRFIASFSDRVFTAFEDISHIFPSDKTEWVGNPVRRCVFEQNPLSFAYDETKPLIYITGGSLGSHSINEHIFALAARLVEHCSVVHQLGDIKEYGDWEKAQKIKRQLDKIHKGRYVPLTHVSEEDIGTIYAKSAFVVGRAGANTFFELILLHKPAILIPLPWSANGEQKAHAQFFLDHKIGEYFDQHKTSEELLAMIDSMCRNRNTYAEHFSQLPLQFKHDAAQKLLTAIHHAI